MVYNWIREQKVSSTGFGPGPSIMKYLAVFLVGIASIFLRSCECAVEAKEKEDVTKADYGEKCTQVNLPNGLKSSNCAPGLKCVNHECECSTDTVYDKVIEKCVSKIGKYCGQTSKYNGEMIELFCPENAVCAPTLPTVQHHVPDSMLVKLYNKLPITYLCKCTKGYVADKQGASCNPSLGYGDKCSAKLSKQGLKCDPVAGLACDSGSCSCSAKIKSIFYRDVMHQCVIPVGDTCGGNKDGIPCDANAICSDAFEGIKYAIHSRNTAVSSQSYNSRQRLMSIQNPKCICIPGYKQTAKGKCVGGYLLPCYDSSSCNRDGHQACIDGVCQCDQETVQVFDKLSHSCQLNIGANCSEEEGPGCFGHSECVDGVCTCQDEFSETPNGECLLTHGSKCKKDRATLCNNFEGLACVEGTCKCFDSLLKWDEDAEMCVAKSNNRCGEINLAKDSLEVETPSINQLDPVYPKLDEKIVSHLVYHVGCEDELTCKSDKILEHGYSRCS